MPGHARSARSIRAAHAPGPSRVGLLARWRELRARPLEGLTALWREHGDVVRIALGRDHFILAHPDGIRHVLKDHRENFDKGSSYEDLRLLVGDGLLTTPMADWTARRRAFARAFQLRTVHGDRATVIEAAEQLADHWDAALAGAQRCVRPASHDLGRLALRLSSVTLLGADAAARAGELGAAFERASTRLIERMSSLSKIPFRLPTPANLELRRAIAAIDTILAGVLAAAPSGDGPSFLRQLARIAPERARDEAITFFLAGYDTTANALAWTLHLLSIHPEVQERLRADLDGPLLDAVIAESLRLFPPVPIILRDVIADDEIAGYPIPAGSVVACVPYLAHRHPVFWSDPDEFRPERFVTGATPAAYMPFGVTPRACIGEPMARLWMRVTLATFLRRFRFAPAGGAVTPVPLVTLTPRDGLALEIARVAS